MHFKCSNHLAKPTSPYCRAIPPGSILRRIGIVCTDFGYITAEVFLFLFIPEQNSQNLFLALLSGMSAILLLLMQEAENHGNGVSPSGMMLVPPILLFKTSHLCLSLPSDHFSSASFLKTLYVFLFSSFLYMVHALPINVFLILLPQ